MRKTLRTGKLPSTARIVPGCLFHLRRGANSDACEDWAPARGLPIVHESSAPRRSGVLPAPSSVASQFRTAVRNPDEAMARSPTSIGESGANVNVLPMRNREEDNRLLSVANVADQPVVADAMAPEASFLAAQGLPEFSGIGSGFDSLPEVANDEELSLRVKLGGLLFGSAGDFNVPAQAVALIPSG